MKYNNIIGLDLAKRIFHLVKINEDGKKIASKKLKREDVLSYLTAEASGKENVLVAMEACGSCHYWAQELKARQINVKLLKTKDVQAYAKSKQKNDINDALAIAKAARDPELKAVMAKDKMSQEIMILHKNRQNVIKMRVRMTNSLMAMLLEFGYLTKLPKGKFGMVAADEVEQAYEQGYLSDFSYQILKVNVQQIQLFYQQEKELDNLIKQRNRENAKAIRLEQIIGIGPINASVLSSLSMESYDSAKDFAASLGLVPSQHTTGGKTKLGGISKQGNKYARTMLIQAGRSIVMLALKRKEPQDKILQWARKLYQTKPFNVACVAVANKLARVAYGVTMRQLDYIAS